MAAPASPHTVLAIAGTGPLHDSLNKQATDCGLAKRVFLLGHLDDVNLFLDACDIFVLSSLSEALPFALLEAMAHELPVVGTQVGGVPEVIVPGMTGFLAPPRDAAALASAMDPLLASANLRRRLGRCGRERIVNHFREADMVAKTMDVYRGLLGRNGQP